MWVHIFLESVTPFKTKILYDIKIGKNILCVDILCNETTQLYIFCSLQMSINLTTFY